jgi:DNA-binding phage protein
MNSPREVLTTYDPAVALINDEEIAFFIADALRTGDAAYIAKVRDIAIRAKFAIQSARNPKL